MRIFGRAPSTALIGANRFAQFACRYHVGNSCAVALAACEREVVNDVVNPGTSRGASVLDIVAAVEKMTGCNVRRDVGRAVCYSSESYRA